VVDGLKALDPEWPIREATLLGTADTRLTYLAPGAAVRVASRCKGVIFRVSVLCHVLNLPAGLGTLLFDITLYPDAQRRLP
jgi:hypothetical protein